MKSKCRKKGENWRGWKLLRTMKQRTVIAFACFYQKEGKNIRTKQKYQYMHKMLSKWRKKYQKERKNINTCTKCYQKEGKNIKSEEKNICYPKAGKNNFY